MITLLNIDCMEYMAGCADKSFDLAIVDPPYGISATKFGMGRRGRNSRSYTKGRKGRLSQGAGKLKNRILNTACSHWDNYPPVSSYFKELFRVSKDQIIWGGNYFDLPPTRCVICWDKEQPWENFSQWEMAWTSFNSPAALFKRQNGNREPGKIHPTQKPIKLYEFLLHKYAKPGHRIIDTHLGSGSSAIAAHYFGCDLVGCEIDTDYYNAAINRLKNETAQEDMFLVTP